MRWVLSPDKKFPEKDDKEVHGEIDGKYHDDAYVSYIVCDPRKTSQPSEGTKMEGVNIDDHFPQGQLFALH